MKIKVSKHAKLRTWERLGVNQDSAESYLNELFEASEEVYNTGQGRAFECKKNGVVLITDNRAEQIITVYQSKGAQLEEEEREIVAKNSGAGLFRDESMREAIWNTFKKRVTQVEKEILKIDTQREKLGYQISVIRRKVYLEKDLAKAFSLKEKYENLVKQRNLLMEKHGDYSREKQVLINETENVLGLHLNEYHSFFREVKKYESQIQQ